MARPARVTIDWSYRSWRSTIWQREASVNTAVASATNVTRGSDCHGGSSADDAEPKTGSLSYGFHPDRFEVDAVQSGVLEQAQAIAQE